MSCWPWKRGRLLKLQVWSRYKGQSTEEHEDMGNKLENSSGGIQTISLLPRETIELKGWKVTALV
jgi:hypothetical protein